MCVPGTRETVLKRLSRRDFLKAAVASAAAVAAGPASLALAAHHDEAEVLIRPARRVVDLTHPMNTDFPTFSGLVQLEIETLTTLADNGFNSKRWLVYEHTGTHMDAPFHFSNGETADEIPIGDLVLPLVVVDIKSKAELSPDAQLTPEDLMAWERRYGRIPPGACVAMNSGWADRLGTDGFRNADANGVMHFPGFHMEATEYLREARGAKAIAVDTLSLDYGQSADFAVHYSWLPSGRWGMENVANLDRLPPRGSTIIAGGPKIVGATGGPSRVLALVHKRKRPKEKRP